MDSRVKSGKPVTQPNKRIAVRMLTLIGTAETPIEAFAVIDDMIGPDGTKQLPADFAFSYGGAKFTVNVSEEDNA